ncbi:MAG TPA: hypothetical protein PLU30_27440 [Verrucomicrobiae bacterium]|nr:hypothetical protein [Verrucomicrobiae bacterium]
MLYAQLSQAIGLNGVCDTLALFSGPVSAARGATAPGPNTLSVIDPSECVAGQRARLLSSGVSALVTPREKVYQPSDPAIAVGLSLSEEVPG